MKSSTVFISLVLCASIVSVLGQDGGKKSKECVKRSLKKKSITLVNLKTIKTDGTAVAFIESGACPVPIPAGDAIFEKENNKYQNYKITLEDGSKCVVEGWDIGPTTMECLKDGVDDKIKRTWEDALYESQPCPKGCDAECKAIDPEWNENALKMFGFKWEEKSKGKKAKSSVTSTATSTTAVTSTAKNRRSVQF